MQVVKMLGNHTIVQFIRVIHESLFLNEIAKPELSFTESESWEWNIANILNLYN